MGKDYPQIWRIIQVSEQFPIQKLATLEKKYLMSNIREKKFYLMSYIQLKL